MERLTDEGLIALYARLEAHYQAQKTFGSREEIQECRQILSALSELLEIRELRYDRASDGM